MEQIRLSGKKHTIGGEYSFGCTYETDTVFKPARSHAMEVEVLCTYAPDSQHGNEGDRPYIAVQEDDVVYCAIEEFKEKGRVEGCEFFEPLTGDFLFRAKTGYYGDIIYFYAFERTSGRWEKAGLCIVYGKEYAGTQDEALLMRVLDEAAQSFRIDDSSGR